MVVLQSSLPTTNELIASSTVPSSAVNNDSNDGVEVDGSSNNNNSITTSTNKGDDTTTNNRPKCVKKTMEKFDSIVEALSSFWYRRGVNAGLQQLRGDELDDVDDLDSRLLIARVGDTPIVEAMKSGEILKVFILLRHQHLSLQQDVGEMLFPNDDDDDDGDDGDNNNDNRRGDDVDDAFVSLRPPRVKSFGTLKFDKYQNDERISILKSFVTPLLFKATELYDIAMFRIIIDWYVDKVVTYKEVTLGDDSDPGSIIGHPLLGLHSMTTSKVKNFRCTRGEYDINWKINVLQYVINLYYESVKKCIDINYKQAFRNTPGDDIVSRKVEMDKQLNIQDKQVKFMKFVIDCMYRASSNNSFDDMYDPYRYNDLFSRSLFINAMECIDKFIESLNWYNREFNSQVWMAESWLERSLPYRPQQLQLEIQQFQSSSQKRQLQLQDLREKLQELQHSEGFIRQRQQQLQSQPQDQNCLIHQQQQQQEIQTLQYEEQETSRLQQQVKKEIENVEYWLDLDARLQLRAEQDLQDITNQMNGGTSASILQHNPLLVSTERMEELLFQVPKLLLDYGCNLDHPSKCKSLLWYNGFVHDDVVTATNSNVSEKSYYLVNAFHRACVYGSLEIAKFLHKHGADIERPIEHVLVVIDETKEGDDAKTIHKTMTNLKAINLAKYERNLDIVKWIKEM